MDDSFEKNFLCGQNGKSFAQIKTHLMSEHRFGSCPCSISFFYSFTHDFAQEIEILLINVVHDSDLCDKKYSFVVLSGMKCNVKI